MHPSQSLFHMHISDISYPLKNIAIVHNKCWSLWTGKHLWTHTFEIRTEFTVLIHFTASQCLIVLKLSSAFKFHAAQFQLHQFQPHLLYKRSMKSWNDHQTTITTTTKRWNFQLHSCLLVLLLIKLGSPKNGKLLKPTTMIKRSDWSIQQSDQTSNGTIVEPNQHYQLTEEMLYAMVEPVPLSVPSVSNFIWNFCFEQIIFDSKSSLLAKI